MQLISKGRVEYRLLSSKTLAAIVDNNPSSYPVMKHKWGNRFQVQQKHSVTLTSNLKDGHSV